MEPREDSLFSLGETAVAHAECAVCLEDLCDENMGPVCVLVGARGHRVCRHFFHSRCADMVLARNVEKLCPCCRREFVSREDLPDPFRDGERWFTLVDKEGEGFLTKTELMDVIAATLDVDQTKIPELIENHWATWDTSGDGHIGPDEMQNMLPFLKKYLPSRRRAEPPFLPEDPVTWFEYFDESCTGCLSIGEVTRGVQKTLHSTPEAAQELVEQLWCLFDFSGSNSVTKEEFVRKKGLADTLVAALGQDPNLKPRVAAALVSSASPPPPPPLPPPPPAPAPEPPLQPPHQLSQPITDPADLLLNSFVPGDYVSIAPHITHPRFGFGVVSPGSIGRVLGTRLADNGEYVVVRVQFPEQAWCGLPSELNLEIVY